MAKTRAQKEQLVSEMSDWLKSGKSAVFSSYMGLTVKDFEDLRKQLRAEQVEIMVAKKSLLALALQNAGITGIDTDTLEGGVTLAVGLGDEVSPARILAAFAKTHQQVKVLGGLLEGKAVDAAMVKALAALPGKQQLLGQLVGTIAAPVSGFARVLAGPARGFVQALNAIAQKGQPTVA